MKKVTSRFIAVLLMAVMASATMIAADWAAFDLKGKVKSVTYYNYSCPYMWPYNDEVKKVSFNASGKVIAPRHVKVVRNKKGVAINFKYYMADWGEWFDQELTYDSNGRVIRRCSGGVDGGGCDENYYDEKGRLYQSIVNAEVEGEEIRIVTYYEYKSFDAKGNWTKRVCTTTTSYISGEFPSETTTSTETRKIVYYK